MAADLIIAVGHESRRLPSLAKGQVRSFYCEEADGDLYCLWPYLSAYIEPASPWLAARSQGYPMPIISMFYGIIIRMYLLDSKHHNLPHIHTKYGEFEASIGIEDADILAGELPRKQLRLVQAWIELHRDELKADWELAVSGENPYKIDPL